MKSLRIRCQLFLYHTTAKKLIQKYLSGEAGSEAASEAVSEEMTMAMTDSMPLRALMGFAGVSRKELDSVIEKLNK